MNVREECDGWRRLNVSGPVKGKTIENQAPGMQRNACAGPSVVFSRLHGEPPLSESWSARTDTELGSAL